MNSCINFSKKYPILLVVLTLIFTYGLIELTSLIPGGKMEFAVHESIRAILVFFITYLFMGKEKVRFSTKGFGYAFRFLRGYLTLMVIIAAFTMLFTILQYVVLGEGSPYELISTINMLIVGLFVGIVEEFIFRGLIFGGLLHKFGNTKKGIVLAAFISGFLFGALHVFNDLLSGNIASVGAAITAVLKICETGIFGIVLAFIYYKVRNLYAVAVIHSLYDFMLFIATNAGNDAGSNYVAGKDILVHVIGYTVFTLFLVPSLIRCFKTLKTGEAVPFDEDFLPRDVEFDKNDEGTHAGTAPNGI